MMVATAAAAVVTRVTMMTVAIHSGFHAPVDIVVVLEAMVVVVMDGVLGRGKRR